MNEKIKSKFETREQWLHAAVGLMAGSIFKAHGYEVPGTRVSCGWPSKGALKENRRSLGECWHGNEEHKNQIFISPYLVTVADGPGGGVLPVLVHEVAHTVAGKKAKHGAAFAKVAKAVGLTGKMTATVAGPELTEMCENWAEELGEYPHSSLDFTKEAQKKQTTRMIKCECSDGCGYTARVTRKWLESVGAPICPCQKHAMSFELPEGAGEEEGGDSAD